MPCFILVFHENICYECSLQAASSPIVNSNKYLKYMFLCRYQYFSVEKCRIWGYPYNTDVNLVRVMFRVIERLCDEPLVQSSSMALQANGPGP